MIRSGCGASLVGASVQLQGIWFESRPTTNVGVLLWSIPFQWGHPNGRPGSTPGPYILSRSSSKNGAADNLWRVYDGTISDLQDERRWRLRVLPTWMQVKSLPAGLSGSSSMVERQPFGILQVAWFDSRLPHCRSCSPIRELVLRTVVRSVAGALASENDDSNNTRDQAEAQQREVYWFGHREKVLLFSRGSTPRTTVLWAWLNGRAPWSKVPGDRRFDPCRPRKKHHANFLCLTMPCELIRVSTSTSN